MLLVLVSVLMGLMMPGCSVQDTETDNLAPDFSLYDLEGNPVSISDFRGEPVILNFWATWCGPCVYEMPLLQQVYDELSAEELVLLTINTGESASRVEDFLQANNYSLPVLLDRNQEVALKYGIRYIPTTFFIDKDGAIQDAKIGPFTSKEMLEERISKIMP